MMTINTNNDRHASPLLSSTVGELVARHPARARLFEKLGMDYCCGGNLSLAEACEAHDQDAVRVLAMLEGLDLVAEEAEAVDLLSLNIRQLCENIVIQHHEWLHSELPRLEGLLQKCSRHAERWHWLVPFTDVYDSLLIELATHMDQEEKLLFPAILKLESCGAAAMGHAAIRDLLGRLEHEHEETGQALGQLRELSGGYAPPAGSCNTMRAMLAGMEELERNTHIHVHKENSVLFPAVRRMCDGLELPA